MILYEKSEAICVNNASLQTPAAPASSHQKSAIESCSPLLRSLSICVRLSESSAFKSLEMLTTLMVFA